MGGGTIDVSSIFQMSAYLKAFLSSYLDISIILFRHVESKYFSFSTKIIYYDVIWFKTSLLQIVKFEPL